MPSETKPQKNKSNVEIRKEIRKKDSVTLREIFPTLQPYLSKSTDTLYWKGKLEFIDGSIVDVMVPEIDTPQNGKPVCYKVLAKHVPTPCAKNYKEFKEQNFNTAGKALSAFKREMNLSLFRALNE